MNNTDTRTTLRLAAMLALASAALATASCNLFVPAAVVLAGPPTTKAAFDLPSDRRLAIFVDDRANKLPKRSLRDAIGTATETFLLQEGELKESLVVPTAAATRLSATEDADRPMSTVDFGRALGVEVLVHVVIEDWTLSRDGGTLTPAASARLRVYDTLANERLFPATEAGYPVRVNSPARGNTVPNTPGERALAERALAEELGRVIAQSFYKHETQRTSVSNQ